MDLYKEVHERYLYHNGKLYHRQYPRLRKEVGSLAGSHFGGYLQACLNKRMYGIHRLVWLMFNGELSKLEIDHINGDSKDNRIENLREVTKELNLHNRQVTHKNNKLGLKYISKNRYSYTVKIVRFGVTYRKSFNQVEAAIKYRDNTLISIIQ